MINQNCGAKIVDSINNSYICHIKNFVIMLQPNTEKEFHAVLAQCRRLFVDKMKDYGPAWRILRTPSITDQIFIKTKRIRTLQTTTERLVDEGIEPEFIGIVNYAAMGIIQLQLGVVDQPDLSSEEASALYDKVTNEAYELMTRKNHDYAEAWRDMRISSILIVRKTGYYVSRPFSKTFRNGTYREAKSLVPRPVSGKISICILILYSILAGYSVRA